MSFACIHARHVLCAAHMPSFTGIVSTLEQYRVLPLYSKALHGTARHYLVQHGTTWFCGNFCVARILPTGMAREATLAK